MSMRAVGAAGVGRAGRGGRGRGSERRLRGCGGRRRRDATRGCACCARPLTSLTYNHTSPPKPPPRKQRTRMGEITREKGGREVFLKRGVQFPHIKSGEA